MNTCYPDPVTIATIVIAIATVVNVWVAYCQWRAARKSAEIAMRVFETANRPYVGVDLLGCQKDELSPCLNVQANIKNFGTAPAENCDIGWKVYINGIEQAGTGFSTHPAVIFPGLTVYLRGIFVEPHCTAIMTGKSTLEIIVHFLYRWQHDKSHIYEEKYRYEHTQRAFITLGVTPRDSKP